MGDCANNKTVCFSGRRRIGAAKRLSLERALFKLVKDLAGDGYTSFICGGALGFDTLAAVAVIKHKREFDIKLTLAVPHKGQEDSWPENDRKLYGYILNHADEIVCLADKYYGGCMQARNRYMVDKSGLLVAYSTGVAGGTAYTCAYAVKQGVSILHL